MPVETPHPEYAAIAPDYDVMCDAHAGERCIKEAGFTYLPPTSGMLAKGADQGTTTVGWKMYEAYRTRSVFPDLVREAIAVMVGVMHRKAPDIKLPRALEPMREVATSRGEALEQLLRRINEQQLLYGRYGLLADVSEARDVPHLVGYRAPFIINWDTEPVAGVDALNLVVLNESGQVRNAADPYTRREQKRFRVLFLGPEAAPGEEPAEGADLGALYRTLTVTDGQNGPIISPSFRGRALTRLPFVLIGANDLDATPDEIPLLGLANLALAIYRGEADYRQTLFMQGQDTLVIVGAEEEGEDEKPVATGAGAVLRVPLQGDAKYIGVTADGLAEQRQALDADRTRAREAGSRLLEPRRGQAESGEALKIRVAAQTASLYQIALTGAAGLERVLRACAEWVGADPDEVSVTPNLDFAETPVEPRGAVDLMTAKGQGLPLSEESIHRWLERNDYTALSYEREKAKIAAESPLPAQGEAPDPAPAADSFPPAHAALA